MRLRRLHVLALSPLLALPACAVAPPGFNPPVTMQSQGTYQTNHAPESPNSLPPGADVLAAFTSPTGQLNTTQVGPMLLPAGRPVP